MTYGTLANIKILCGIDSAEDSFDTALTMCLSKADDFINNTLAPYALVPIASPDAVIVDIAEFMRHACKCRNPWGSSLLVVFRAKNMLKQKGANKTVEHHGYSDNNHYE